MRSILKMLDDIAEENVKDYFNLSNIISYSKYVQVASIIFMLKF